MNEIDEGMDLIEQAKAIMNKKVLKIVKTNNWLKKIMEQVGVFEF